MKVPREPVQLYSALCALVAGTALTVVVAHEAGEGSDSAAGRPTSATQAVLVRSTTGHQLALANETAARRRYATARRTTLHRQLVLRRHVLDVNRAVRRATRTGVR